ncbi:MAG TPA: phosphodiester glycosidase family protein [Roseiarcus sp.]|nr:phosphodiester glycosidase family protein [Roseiarcus sp.]
MTRRNLFAASTILLGLACGAVAPAGAACAPKDFDGARFTICVFDPRHEVIRLFWKDEDGRPYGSLSALAGSLRGKGQRLAFAMNAGMFKQDQSPVGLYVENGQKLQPADTRGGGASNFHMKPNGVFWIGDGAAGVTETSRYLAAQPAARYATQSGPMLIVDGRIHPRILPSGTSAKIRNGVGISDSGAVEFAIADEPVTFDAFARLFRDGLGCKNALFLDGSVSSLYAPELKRDDEIQPIGPIVGVVRPEAVGASQ